MAFSKNSNSSNLSAVNSSEKGSGIEDLTDRLLPTADEFLTHPEYALCLPIGPLDVVPVTLKCPSHCLSKSCLKEFSCPMKFRAFSSLLINSTRLNSVLANAVSNTLNWMSCRILGWLKENSFSRSLESPQKILNRKKFNIFVSDTLLHTFQKVLLRVNSDEGEYACHFRKTVCLLRPSPISIESRKRGSMDTVLFVLAIISQVVMVQLRVID